MNDWDDLTQEERDDFRIDASRRAVPMSWDFHVHRWEPIVEDIKAGKPYEECRFRCLHQFRPACVKAAIPYAETRPRFDFAGYVK